MSKYRLITSDSYDPWINLALEEQLFNSALPDTVIMYLWQNDSTVVIGKSQNAWKECRVSVLEENGGKLARRPSGGGAVYHDLGNVCYTFITTSGLYDLNKQLLTVLKAVRLLGVDASFTGRNDITLADGRKFSGNAFRFVKDKGLMHGTLLVDTDFEAMSEYLSVSKAKLKAKGVDSVRSRVANLKEVKSDISIKSVKRALEDAFCLVYGYQAEMEHYGVDDVDPSLKDKYSSWDWRFGLTPVFDMSISDRFSWGGTDIQICSEHGIIRSCKIFTDAMDADLLERIARDLTDCPIERDCIVSCVSETVKKSSKEHILADKDVICVDVCGLLMTCM